MGFTVRELVTKIGFDVDQAALSRAEKSVNNLKKITKQVAIGFTIAASSVGLFINEAAKMEQVNIAFTTILGSAEAAEKKLGELFAFAEKTPFTIPGVLSSAKQLLAVGIEADKLLPTLKALGDVSAGLSVPLSRLALNFGQVKTQGKLTGRELRDFAVAGVPLAAELAKTLGKTTSEIQNMVSKGKIGFDLVEQAFINMTTGSGRFADLMDKQSKSFFGILSNIKDSLQILSAEIGKDLLPAAKEMLKTFLNFVEVNRELIKSRLASFLRTAANFMFSILSIVRSLVRTFVFLSKSVGGVENAVKLLMRAFVALFALRIVTAIGAITLAIFAMIKGFIAATFATQAYRLVLAKLAIEAGFTSSAFKLLGNSALIAQAKLILIPVLIGAALVALALVIDDFINFIAGNDSVLGKFIGRLERIGKFFRKFSIANRQTERTVSEGLGGGQQANEARGSFFGDAANFLGQLKIGSVTPGLIGGIGATARPQSQQGNTVNVKIDAPININGAQSPENVSSAVQKGLEQGLDVMLRKTLISNQSILDF